MSHFPLPLIEIDSENFNKIKARGGKPLHLYQILAHHPKLLSSWLDFSHSLRADCKTPRSLRELMILRGAQLTVSEYEWQQHYTMALNAGVTQIQIDHLKEWKTSVHFSDQERLALELAEALMVADVPHSLCNRLLAHFSAPEYLELILTGSFYVMVPRVLNGLKVPLE
jgi:4-carboxymuconolactone decarboxylase